MSEVLRPSLLRFDRSGDVEIDVGSLRDAFFDEASEHVSVIEAALLELERGVRDRELLDRVFRSAHSIKGGSAALGFSDVTRLTHALESWLEPLRDGLLELESDEGPSELLFSATDVLKATLFAARAGAALPPELPAVVAELERASRSREVSPPERAAPLELGAENRVLPTRRGSTLRVSTEKLDKLVNLVGELMISQSAVSQALKVSGNDSLGRVREAMAALELNTRELQELVMSVRMVPMGSVFARFPRLVRDLKKLGKEVELELEGEGTEIDKEMIEQLIDPLTHLIRNAVDHGIEPPELRLRAGKPEQGLVKLSAFHQGSGIVIEVADDGAGLDEARIRERAIDRGLVGEAESLGASEIGALIFEPGFTTASAVTDVSGRGVGLDVVRRNIEAMGGSVDVSSTRSVGTRFRVRLPLTLAIMDGLLLRVGEQSFVVPLAAILESFRPDREQCRSIPGHGEIVRVRGEVIPLVRLHAVLGVDGLAREPWQALVVLVETGSRRLGLLVDELVGQAQIVVKSLETHYRRVEGVTGATILGDGRIALILDVESIARQMLPRAHDASAGFVGGGDHAERQLQS